jgi:hypothetical protein
VGVALNADLLTRQVAQESQKIAAEFDLSFRNEAARDLDFSASLYAQTRAAELAQVDWTAAQKQSFCRQ